jgi:four helix bundle protein
MECMKDELQKRTKRFALNIISLVSQLPRNKAAAVIGYQLLRSGTSIGANYREAARAYSHDEFIHKIGVCEKEAAETQYWIELLIEGELATSTRAVELLREAGELLAMLVASGRTAKTRRNP